MNNYVLHISLVLESSMRDRLPVMKNENNRIKKVKGINIIIKLPQLRVIRTHFRLDKHQKHKQQLEVIRPPQQGIALELSMNRKKYYMNIIFIPVKWRNLKFVKNEMKLRI